MRPLNDARCIDADDYIKCIEDEAFSVEEVFPFKYKLFNATPFYSDLRNGIAQSVKINPGAISTSAAQTINMKLNPNMSYIIMLTDPKMQFTSYNPEVIPRIVLTYAENVGIVSLYLKVKAFPMLYFAFYIITSFVFRSSCTKGEILLISHVNQTRITIMANVSIRAS